jgi:methyl-accepting chemotaxis protein
MFQGIAFKYRRLLSELIPIFFALAVAVSYFLTAVPNSRPYWGKYILAVFILLVADRILIVLYFRRKILPPLVAYKKGRREGRAFSRAQLSDFYREFAVHVTRSQVVSLAAWAMAAVLLALISFFWIQRSWVAFVGILFTGLIAASVSISTSYFFIKWLIGPLQEEVMTGLDQLPDVSSKRVPFRVKVGGSVLAFAAITFLAFGVLLYSRLAEALDTYALTAGHQQASELSSMLSKIPGEEWASAIKERANALWTVVPVDQEGHADLGAASGHLNEKVFDRFVFPSGKLEPGARVITDHGSVRLYPVTDAKALALVANPDFLTSVTRKMSTFGLGFLAATLFIFGLYIYWLSRDLAGVLGRMVDSSKRLSAGDLRHAPAIWSDDELGTMADQLRGTFQGLGRMTREIAVASASVDSEVARTTNVVAMLHEQVAAQVESADRTTLSVKAMEEGIQRVSKAMEQVANATQEVSSTILEMQASVEEIARNADVLIQSVEKTVSSSNEISASAGEIKSSTDKLHQSGQEAVSFLSELDASLEETRRSAKALSESATTMTQDAEAGFSSVAAVEQEILRTSQATDQSRAALRDLVASIERIGRIVGVIQDVTEQTNLLSLNASIIAAGAGEYGKSFAVVATQIRELSARTAGNAKEIRALIGSLTQSGAEMASAMENTSSVVQKSADLSRTAGDALRTILESASAQEEMNKRIASATEELAHGGQSANRAMHQIFEMIEGIGRATADQVSSTRYLNEEAERVRDVALQLKNATEEQAKGTRVISQAVTGIMSDSRQTTQAIQAQASEAVAIHDAMKRVAASSQAIERAFGDLAEASSHLQRSAAVLRQQIQSFKTA